MVQHAALSVRAAPTAARLREMVTGRLAQLRQGERLDSAALAQRQAAALRVIADHAARFSPGFAARLERAELRAADLGGPALQALPPLTRAELQASDAVYARAIPETHLPTHSVETTGSTGQPVRVIHTLVTQVEWLALALLVLLPLALLGAVDVRWLEALHEVDRAGDTRAQVGEEREQPIAGGGLGHWAQGGLSEGDASECRGGGGNGDRCCAYAAMA